MNWDLTWIGYIGGAVLGFGVLETLGIVSRNSGRSNGTLTSALRRWLGIDPKHLRRFILGPAFGLLLAWFGIHILTPWL